MILIFLGSEVTYEDWMKIPRFFRELIADEIGKNYEAVKQMMISFKKV